MKCGGIILAMLMASGVAQGQLLLMGTQEIGARGAVDFDTSQKTEVDFGLSYGYFVFDYLEAKGDFLFYDNDSTTRIALLFGCEYNFDFGGQLVPFLGAGAGLGRLRYHDSGASHYSSSSKEKEYLLLGVSGGLKYFLAENVALSAAINANLATEKIYMTRNDMSRADVTLDWGLRLFF